MPKSSPPRINSNYRWWLFLLVLLSPSISMLSAIQRVSSSNFRPSNFAVAMSSSSNAASSASSCVNSPAALVFLHGLGDTPAGWSSIQYSLPSMQESLKNIKYVFPHAPTIGISINGGMKMPGWFDLYDWPIGVGSKDDPDGLSAAVKQIENEVEKLQKEHGIPKSRIVLGGFSQGGAVAMLAAYKGGDEPYAGCIALSGWLTLEDDLSKTMNAKAAKATPLFWGHGQYDDKVLFEQQAHGITKLKAMGVTNIQHSKYPMGHQSSEREMEDMSAFLHSVLFEETTKAES